MKRIGFSGTLDPITNGHMWVIGEARAMADEVFVFLSENPSKKPQFPPEKRKQIIELSAAERGWNNVKIVILKGEYTARAAKRHGIDYLIRGIRNTSDFDYENLIQQTNVDVLHGAKTIFVMPPRDLGSVSSGFVKNLQGPLGWHWHMKKFVPVPAYDAWLLDWLDKEWASLWDARDLDAQTRDRRDRWFAHLSGASCYGDTRRCYHNRDHLVHGLTEIGVWAENTSADKHDVDTIKKAFWFHDAVYDYTPADLSNEEASARLWLDSGLAANGDGEPAQLIRATDHFQGASISHRLKDIMLGADLAILGQDDEIYDAYAESIRAEYSHVPDASYQAHRLKALSHLMQKAQNRKLYADDYFSALYNDKAIVNMTREIDRLAGQK
ncbi:MAG: pantetheine-phosphate adenylyltransferase [Pseudomonadota bacterium]